METTVYLDKYHKKETNDILNMRMIILDHNSECHEYLLTDFHKDEVSVGRDPSRCDIVINAPFVSGRHIVVKKCEDEVYFYDDNSTNGTILDNNGYQTLVKQDYTARKILPGTMLRIQPSGSHGAHNSVLILFADNLQNGDWSRIAVKEGKITIGRQNTNKIILNHPCVSAKHAVIQKQKNKTVITDLDSKNGVFVNGRQIQKTYELQEKDVIRILNSTLIYVNGYVFYKMFHQGVHIDVQNVDKVVGKGTKTKKILNQVNCRIESNDFVAIIGGSGAGKSTVMNAISGFDPKFTGNILYNGMEIKKHFQSLKDLIGYVPQEDIIYENLTLRKMLYYTAKLKMPGDTSKSEIEERIVQVLRMVELLEHQNTFIRKLSGGQKKRASIAVELLADPQVFFLDEPTSGLDPGTEQNLMKTLQKLAKEEGKTIIMVTHTTQSLELCDKVLFMGNGGRLCFCGTTEEAKEYFHTDSLIEIYHMISENSKEWSAAYNSSYTASGNENKEEAGGITTKKKKQSRIKQVPILTARYIELIKNDLMRFMILFLQPVIIALALVIVANENAFDIYEDTKSILFALSCAGIWIGLFNSIQEICKERAILKREYMGNLRLSYYVFSKFFVQTILAFLQALVMTGIFTILVGQPEEGILFANPFAENFIVVWMTIESSMALGFVISSIVKGGDKAMTLAPFALIIQLLFSGILFELKGIAEKIAYVTISKWSVESLGSIAHLNDLSLKMQEQIPTLEHEFQEIYESTDVHLFTNLGILVGMTVLCAVVCCITLRRVAKDGR